MSDVILRSDPRAVQVAKLSMPRPSMCRLVAVIPGTLCKSVSCRLHLRWRECVRWPRNTVQSRRYSELLRENQRLGRCKMHASKSAGMEVRVHRVKGRPGDQPHQRLRNHTLTRNVPPPANAVPRAVVLVVVDLRQRWLVQSRGGSAVQSLVSERSRRDQTQVTIASTRRAWRCFGKVV